MISIRGFFILGSSTTLERVASFSVEINPVVWRFLKHQYIENGSVIEQTYLFFSNTVLNRVIEKEMKI